MQGQVAARKQEKAERRTPQIPNYCGLCYLSIGVGEEKRSYCDGFAHDRCLRRSMLKKTQHSR